MPVQASSVIIAYVVLSAVSVSVVFALAALSGHLDAFPPFLGDLGDRPLESTVFTQCFVGDAAVLVLVVHLRFVYVTHYLSKGEASPGKALANAVGVAFGHAAAAGLFVMACFQRSHAFYVHASAFVLFLSGSVVYFVTQSVVSAVSNARTSVLRMRFFFNVGMVTCFVLFVGGYAVAEKPSRAERPSFGGRIARLLSASAQWVLLVLFQAYIISFWKEFRQVMITKTRIIVVPKEEEEEEEENRVDPQPFGKRTH